MSLLVKSGIYKIVNTLNNKFYVGSSVSLKKRHNDHFNSLLPTNTKISIFNMPIISIRGPC